MPDSAEKPPTLAQPACVEAWTSASWVRECQIAYRPSAGETVNATETWPVFPPLAGACADNEGADVSGCPSAAAQYADCIRTFDQMNAERCAGPKADTRAADGRPVRCKEYLRFGAPARDETLVAKRSGEKHTRTTRYRADPGFRTNEKCHDLLRTWIAECSRPAATSPSTP